MQNNSERLLGLDALSSDQLRSILHEEVDKTTPDDDLVVEILHILETREPPNIENLTPGEEAARKRFRRRITARKRKKLLHGGNIAKAASLILVMGLLFAAIPQQAEADSLWNRLARWSDDFFSYFHPHLDEEPQTVYEFHTDNPGLQEVYDAVVEMGITEPVVPMWLPGEFELVECKQVDSKEMKYTSALFTDDNHAAVIVITNYHESKVNQYHKDNLTVLQHEEAGIIHNIIKNHNQWSIIWTIDNTECSISIDCQEDLLYEIIESIYQWRINDETVH
ncbi:MAG: DUF4367 domain-containing protein [Oscillospiraceae bacterium]|nr:DUF4367 domain-containing protein [Oscillospiraceae bacterium]